MNKEKLKKHIITCKEYPNMTISAEVLGLIIEALLEEDKEEVKVKEKPQHKPQHKPTKENLGFELRYNGIIVKPLYLAFAFKAYKNNNWFPTKELAEKQRDKNQAITRVKEYIVENFGVFEPDWGDEDEWKYEFGYSHARDILEEGAINTFKYYSPIGYLKSENNAQQLIKDCKEELEIIYK